jgi:hypothetical protein
VLIAMGVLQHVGEVGAAVSEMRRVAKPDAQMLIADERRAEARILAGLDREGGEVDEVGDYFVISQKASNRFEI